MTTGTRSRAKAERRQRLKDAALAIFSEKGYQAATTREIAVRAGVGPATLYRYAEEKRDLLLMIVNDDLNSIDETALAKVDLKRPLVDTLMVLMEPRFAYWGARPLFSREVIHETVLARAQESDTFEARRYRNRRQALLSALSSIVRAHQDAGDIRRDQDAAEIAGFLLEIHLAHVRHWLSEPKPIVSKGVAGLRRLFTFAIEGVGNARVSEARIRRAK